MTRVAAAVVATAALVGATRAEARVGGVGDFGIGIVIGEPTGLTGEIFLARRFSLDFAVGVASWEDRNLYVHLDFKVYPVDIVRGGTASLPLYLGIGPWIYNPGDDLYMGARAPLGLAIHFRNAPLQLFFEVALKLWFVKPAGVDRFVDGDVNGGFRIFF